MIGFKKEVNVKEFLKTLRKRIELDEGVFESNKALIELGEEDSNLLRYLRRRLRGRVTGELFHDFYVRISRHEEARKYFSDESTVEKLKRKQVSYIRELLGGRYDLEYLDKRIRLGLVHLEKGVRPHLFTGAYFGYVKNIFRLIDEVIREDMRSRMREAFLKVILLDLQLVFEGYFGMKEEQISHYIRLYAVLSAINQAITTGLTDEQNLFQTVCDICVEEGEFPLAWIGLVEKKSGKVIPVAASGKTGYLEGIEVSTDPKSPTGRGPTGDAIRRGEISLCRNIVRERRMKAWKEKARKFGLFSSASVPFEKNGEVAGTLNIYAEVPHFFDDEEEVVLLKEIGLDICHGLEVLEKERKITYLSFHDQKTGLPNREYFMTILDEIIGDGAGEEVIAVISLDILRMEKYLDILGVDGADKLVRVLAGKLLSVLRYTDIVGRLGRSQIGVILRDIRDEENITRGPVWRKMLRELEKPLEIEGKNVFLEFGLGAAIYPRDGKKSDDLIKMAELSGKEVKKSGEIVFYTKEMGERLSRAMRLEERLRTAVRENQFVIYYQPKVDLKSGRLAGLEALIRWDDPDEGMQAPGGFIHILEETGLIHEIGVWIIREVSSQQAKWISEGYRPVKVSVNVSSVQLNDWEFVEFLRGYIGKGEMDPAQLELEVTESILIRENLERIREIKNMGIGISIDDFGTGYSSLSYMRDLPVDTLKIDISFVRELGRDPDTLALVSTIIALARNFDLKTVAEGVEEVDQLKLLSLLKCDEYQGYYCSPPLPAHEVEKYLEKVN